MPKAGIKILSETFGSGPELKKGDLVRLLYDIEFNRGGFLAQDRESIFNIGTRDHLAGFRYGLEGIRAGGTRRFIASAYLCYRDLDLDGIPKNSALIFDIKEVELLGYRK
jgi:FKBP-type peptidyl-prolyl cis-trans isomerase